MEPPKGMRANLLRTFTDLPEEFLDLYGSPQVGQGTDVEGWVTTVCRGWVTVFKGCRGSGVKRDATTTTTKLTRRHPPSLARSIRLLPTPCPVPQEAAEAGLPEGASTKAQAAAWKKLVFACAFFHATLQVCVRAMPVSECCVPRSVV